MLFCSSFLTGCCVSLSLLSINLAMSRTNRFLINDVGNCVDEMLESIALQNPGLRQIRGHRVIIREDAVTFCKKGLVSTVSGGGSGHEPFAAGFVGKGMLTAAVAGSVFASPPPVDILAAIQASASPAGTLLIVANYTGDRLNFGIALERAKAMGHNVKMLVVGEDCALESSDKTAGRRGLVGIVNVMKIAGALAEEGKSLDEILAVSEAVTKSMGTIGVSLSGCSIPGTGSSFELDDSEMELGLGAHGEAGVKKIKILPADETVTIMIDHMTKKTNASRLNLESKDKVAIIMNNLGGLSAVEMHVMARKVIQLLESKGIEVERFISGYFMTSLDMAGLNLNVLKLNDVVTACLDADTTAPGWPRISTSLVSKNSRRNDPFVDLAEHNFAVKSDSSRAKKQIIVSDAFLNGIQCACRALIAKENYLNELDTSCGDGDCGATLKRGSNNVLSKINEWKGLSTSDVLHNVAACAELSMGGASGGLYSLFFTAASSLAVDTSLETLKRCLDAGMLSIVKYGKAEPGDRTMLDALIAASSSFEVSIKENHTVTEAFKASALKVRKAAEDTSNMKAKAGRASYVAAELLTHPDPGASAVAVIFESINQFCISL